MDPVLNPYAPGAGLRPPEMAGREAERSRFRVLLDRIEKGRPERGLILTGLRGVGKTVLLDELRSMADQREWIVGFVEAGMNRPIRELAARALMRSLRATSIRRRSSARLRRALGVFKSFSLKASPDGSLSFGIDIEPVSGLADSGNLELDMTDLFLDLGEAASEMGAGVLLLVDELQELASSEIAALAGAVHQTNRLRLPVAIVGAGLPNLPSVMTEAKSYAERLFGYLGIRALSATGASDALRRPAETLGVTWQADALAHAVDASGAYPYFLQVFGSKIWDYASTAHSITFDDARVGVRVARSDLDEGFYGTRFERATPAQRVYLAAMSAEGADALPVTTRQVASRLGKTQGRLGPYRHELIRKGLIYAPARGQVAFTVPGMGAYIERLGASHFP